MNLAPAQTHYGTRPSLHHTRVPGRPSGCIFYKGCLATKAGNLCPLPLCFRSLKAWHEAIESITDSNQPGPQQFA